MHIERSVQAPISQRVVPVPPGANVATSPQRRGRLESTSFDNYLSIDRNMSEHVDEQISGPLAPACLWMGGLSCGLMLRRIGPARDSQPIPRVDCLVSLPGGRRSIFSKHADGLAPRQIRHPIRVERQPYARSVLCPTSIMYPSGSRM